MKATKSLNKICALKKRIRVVQGGQGAGKTWAILIILIDFAFTNPNKEIFICSDELSKMRITIIKDFLKIMRLFERFDRSQWVDGTLYRFENGSFIKFIGLDKADIGKGLRSDVLFINEANKTNFETYREITSRAKNVYLDFNPNNEFWVHEEVVNRSDCDFLKLTYKDNEYLSIEEKTEIELYYKKGYDSNGNIINDYWANMWQVYGLGNIGRLQGSIYQNWIVGSFAELPHAYGLDFGVKDPDALVKCAIDRTNMKIYLHEEIYQNGQSTKELYELIKSRITNNGLIVADSSGARHILDLKNYGLNIESVHKLRVLEYIKLLMNYQLVVTETSTNLIKELNNWRWIDKKGQIPLDGSNHLIDATHYIVGKLCNNSQRSNMRVLS
ncbi:MAG: Phage terminase large subunit [Bacteroidetes bacterium ADurb.Bin217]|nr:MAG: Phage terminase large subunit [Bacteroidetes bacterium ADurb.Bin217]